MVAHIFVNDYTHSPVSILIPVFLAFLGIVLVLITDYTPNYGIDATELLDIFGKNIAIFGVLAFWALTVFGVLQTIYIIQAHNRSRKEALTVYKSIGMTEDGIRKALKYEYGVAAFHAMLYLAVVLIFVLVGF